MNKKGFHSVGCLLACDARGLLLSAETHWPGGLRDTDVFERSALLKQLQDTEEGWLLGEMGISAFLRHFTNILGPKMYSKVSKVHFPAS